MSRSLAAVAANALDTNGATAPAPYAAPAVIAPRSMKLERVMPWTSTAPSSGLTAFCDFSSFRFLSVISD